MTQAICNEDTMACLKPLKGTKNICKLQNTLGLMIFLILFLSLALTLWNFLIKEESEGPLTLQDKWSPVRGLNDTYVFNAYFTGRDTFVRIVGVGPSKSKPKVQCNFYRKDEDTFQNEASDDLVLGTLVQMLDAHNQSHNNIEIQCPLHNGVPPLAVSVSGLETLSEYYLKINYPPDNNFKFNFSICTPALHSNYSEFSEVVQSVEIDRLLGAQKFTFYYLSASPEVDVVLRMYRETGVMEIVPWDLPNVKVHYFAQVASIRDCFYRNMHTSNYIVFKDLDEVLLPFKHSGWSGLIDDLLKIDPLAGAFVFRNSFVHKLGPDVTENMNKEAVDMAKSFGLYTLLKRFRQTAIWPYKLRAKFIVNPMRAHNVEIHQVRALIKGYNLVVVNETLGIMFHYRKSVDRKLPTVRDPAMRKYKDALIEKVDNIYYILNKKYTNWKPIFHDV